ncbi:hypothetical protein BACCAC_03856 [Bacteroides caccae ATCC 43185]|nr:hypothetical protein BACCAC_03856 [Bacteroides caccae ATCC 43185]
MPLKNRKTLVSTSERKLIISVFIISLYCYIFERCKYTIKKKILFYTA